MAQSGRTFLVECYLPGIAQADVAAAGDRARRAADQLLARGREVAYLGAMLVEADEAVFHAFRASDAAVVEEASRAARLEFTRVVESIDVRGDDMAVGLSLFEPTRSEGRESGR